MSMFVLGLNHKTAPIDLRERFAFGPGQVAPALQGLRGAMEQAPIEAALLSTCNRTELYVASSAPAKSDELASSTLAWLSEHGDMAADQLRSYTYLMRDRAATRHAFRVASGLDSMALGESQILGQMKRAQREAIAAGTLGTTLGQLFQRTFAVAKQVRTTTEIGAHSVSIAAAAVRLAGKLFEDMRDIRVLFVGAGDMIGLAATHFSAQRPVQMMIANRSAERSEDLARRFNAATMPLAELPLRLNEFDVIVSCTASTLPIIGLGAVERALKLRRRRPILLIDLAVPRDIEAEVRALPDVYLYTIDDLSNYVQNSTAQRQAAVQHAEAIIAVGEQGFASWLEQRSTVPLIQALNQRADSWRAEAAERARKMLARGDALDDVVELLSRTLTRKMLHGTMTELRDADAQQREAITPLLYRLFLRDGSRAPSAGAH